MVLCSIHSFSGPSFVRLDVHVTSRNVKERNTIVDSWVVLCMPCHALICHDACMQRQMRMHMHPSTSTVPYV